MAGTYGVSGDREDVLALAMTNYGHFTSMLVENLHVRGLSLHLDRLQRDCRALFAFELDQEKVRALIRAALTGSTEPTVARVTVFDPALDFGRPGGPTLPQVLVTTRPQAPAAATGLRLQSTRYLRDMPEVKHVGLFPTLRLRRAAQLNGFDDVLFLGPDGRVSELATSNVGIISGDRVTWPDAACLPGVTMRLLDRARGEHRSRPLTLADVAEADAVFATNAAVGIRAVWQIDDFRWPTEEPPILAALRDEYGAVTAESL